MTKINPFTGEAIDSTVRAKPKRKQFVKNARTDRKNPFALTNSEKMVLRELAEGFSNAEIAEFLSVSQRTIESHVSNMMSSSTVPIA